MDHQPESRPWERLLALAESGDSAATTSFLHDLSPGETARAFSRINDEGQAKILNLLGPEDAADIIERLSDVQAADILEELSVKQAARIVDEMPSDHQADVLAELDVDEAEAIIDQMAPEEASDARRLMQYPSDTAGGLMITEYLAYPEDARIIDVLDDLREHGERYSDYDVQYAYITADSGVLVGVLRLRDVLMSRRDALVRAIMIPAPSRVVIDAGIEELNAFFEEHAFFGVPVVDDQGRLVGVVRRSAVDEAQEAAANQNFLKLSGLRGREELRSMPLHSRSLRRLSWLSINIVLNIAAASVIAFYQDTLAAVIALAVFLPIISDMSGCSGNQAVAVSMRELTLGLVKPFELLRVLAKEASVGLLNGLVLGLLLGGVAYLWKGNVYLGLVVGAAMFLNTLVSVVLGGLIPLLLKRMNFDPALAASPILTTVTDVCGFFFVLGFATMSLNLISGA